MVALKGAMRSCKSIRSGPSTLLPDVATSTGSGELMGEGLVIWKENTTVWPAPNVWPEATDTTKVPVAFVQTAVFPNKVLTLVDPTSDIASVPESAVCDPDRPCMVNFELADPCKFAVAAKETVMVLRAPGKGVLCEICFTHIE